MTAGAHPSISFDTYRAQRRLDNLDGLRGIAILLVLVHHIPEISIEWIAGLQEHSKHGVSLFFVISGYIITTLLLREEHESGHVDVRGFMVRRALRLWPLYFAILLLEAFLVFGLRVYSAENQTLFSEKLTCYILYCSNWLETSGEGPFFVAWSLAVEEQFYLFVAVLLLFLRSRSLASVAGVLLALKVMLLNVWPQVEPSDLPWRVLLSYSEAILLGVILAVLLDNCRYYTLFTRIFGSLPAVIVLLTAFLGYLVFGPLEQKASPGALFFYLICALLVGASATRPALPLIGGNVLARIGLVSYGIYLMHMPVLSAVKRVTSEPLSVLILTAIIVFPLAWLSHRYFEEPIRRLGRRTKLKGRPVGDLLQRRAWRAAQ